jgi:hypothetical protein
MRGVAPQLLLSGWLLIVAPLGNDGQPAREGSKHTWWQIKAFDSADACEKGRPETLAKSGLPRDYPITLIGAVLCVPAEGMHSNQRPWIVWAGVSGGYVPIAAGTTRAECQEQLHKEHERMGSGFRFFCLPDTVDPRGPRSEKAQP